MKTTSAMQIADRIHTWFENVQKPAALGESVAGLECIACGGPLEILKVFGDHPNVAHCPCCGTQQQHPLPHLHEVAAYYTDYPTTRAPEEQHARLVALNVACLRRALSAAGASDKAMIGKRFLEVGFGNGTGLVAAARLGANATGVDLDSTTLERLRQLAGKFNVKVDALVGELSELGDLQKPFDIIKASHVIEIPWIRERLQLNWPAFSRLAES